MPANGTIIQVIGSTFDAQFPEDQLPAIYNAVKCSVTVAGETSRAGDVYMMLLGVTRTTPGMLVGGTQVPLNYDVFTSIALGAMNTATLPGFIGALDAQGRGTAGLVIPGAIAPALLGLRWNFASLILDIGGNVTSTPPAELIVDP